MQTRPWKFILVALTVSCVVWGADPLVGTFKLNAEKSKLHNPVQSETLKVDLIAPNTYRSVIDIVNTKGEKRHTEVIRIADGKEHPVEAVNRPLGDTQIASPGLRKVVLKKDGKVVSEMEIKASPEGHIVTQTGTDANGKPYKDVIVWERQ